jgi:hypothetical protein
MKTFKILAILLFLSLAISAEASGHPRFRSHHHFNSTQPKPSTVGAPRDGGILAILGVAGAAYFAARKRKKNEKS